ncbi:prepilin peptidase [Bradyrhizobium sp. AUGA SZCCT0169]|uniref:A24 family peptidase n=1 Tax=Bradyrhizobium sp. AUGA SZCCT0169 TaxID=2807663 RepID=UPI001BAE3BBE|nr:prepilin peptidase [Bradyrhizobium sp. AUGA SZCCT0169]MBR1251487.1 prepilin peptidase [Bradyrhizobium sp. AUGA SZCCT0169]
MTAFPPIWAYFVLVVTSALLFWAAWTDLREYKIRNELILALAALFVLYTALTGHWADLKWNVPFAALMFALLLAFYSRRWMGGGDVKILAVAFLWTGLSGALPFAILLALFSTAHSLAAKLGWVKSQVAAGGRRRIPFAPSVAAALICIFMLQSLPLGIVP